MATRRAGSRPPGQLRQSAALVHQINGLRQRCMLLSQGSGSAKQAVACLLGPCMLLDEQDEDPASWVAYTAHPLARIVAEAGAS